MSIKQDGKSQMKEIVPARNRKKAKVWMYVVATLLVLLYLVSA